MKKYFLSASLLLGATIVSCIAGLFFLDVVIGVAFSVCLRGWGDLLFLGFIWFIGSICVSIGGSYFINFAKGRINKYVSRDNRKLVIFNNIVSVILIILFVICVFNLSRIISSLPYYKDYDAHKKEQDRVESGKKEVERRLHRLNELKSKPEDSLTLMSLGKEYRSLGEYEKAIETFKKLIALSPSNIEYHYELGFTYVGYGDLNKAMEEVYVIRGTTYYDANNVADKLEVLIQKKEAEIKSLIQTK